MLRQGMVMVSVSLTDAFEHELKKVQNHQRMKTPAKDFSCCARTIVVSITLASDLHPTIPILVRSSVALSPQLPCAQSRSYASRRLPYGAVRNLLPPGCPRCREPYP